MISSFGMIEDLEEWLSLRMLGPKIPMVTVCYHLVMTNSLPRKITIFKYF